MSLRASSLASALHLDLADALAGEVHDGADLFERRAAAIGDVERAGLGHLPDLEVGEVQLDRAGAGRHVEIEVVLAGDERARARALDALRRAIFGFMRRRRRDRAGGPISSSRFVMRLTLIVRARTSRLRRESALLARDRGLAIRSRRERELPVGRQRPLVREAILFYFGAAYFGVFDVHAPFLSRLASRHESGFVIPPLTGPTQPSP